MIAWIKKKGCVGLTKVDKEIPKLSKDNALVKVITTGICGTDFSIYKGYREVPENLVPGHEFCGKIVELGENVTGYCIGDYVVPSIVNPCLTCWACKNGFEAQCESLIEIGIHIDGSFAEYVSVPVNTLHKISETVPPFMAASIEPVAVAYSAVKKVQGFIPGSDAIVYGPGAIGLYITQMLKLSGVGNIIVLGAKGDEKRLKIAEGYGAYAIRSDTSDADLEIAKIFKKGKANYIFDATGVGQLVGGMLKNLLPHGELVCAGIYKDFSSVNMLELVRCELSIRGSFCYTLSEFENAINMVMENRIDFKGIVEEMFLDNLEVGFQKAISKEAIKIILNI